MVILRYETRKVYDFGETRIVRTIIDEESTMEEALKRASHLLEEGNAYDVQIWTKSMLLRAIHPHDRASAEELNKLDVVDLVKFLGVC